MSSSGTMQYCRRVIYEEAKLFYSYALNYKFGSEVNHIEKIEGSKEKKKGKYMDHQSAAPLPPHVLVFPLPAQSHLSSMLKLSELLCIGNLHVTMLVSEFSHSRLLHHTDVHSHFTRYPGFCFRTIPDGLPEDHPRAGERIMEMFSSMKSVTALLFREMMISTNYLSSKARRPLTCIIADGVLSFAGDFAIQSGISLIYFRTASACSSWANFCMPQLIEAEEIPLKGNGMDLMVKNVPGMEGLLRRRDLPGFCRVDEVNDPLLHFIKTETGQTPRAQALIKNTFDELDGPILSQIRTRCPNLFSIGPLHAHLKYRLIAETNCSSTSSGSFWEEDRSCVTWLDSQPSKSVIYVSFGSITVVTRDQLMEFWYGLVNSGQRFLWVMRPDSIVGKDGESEIVVELVEGTRERGYMVGWAAQEEVLAHPAVGRFLTHSGWNSTLESIVSGVPMICWPNIADQMINSRFVDEVWKLGLDMKDTCDRVIVEKMVRDLMDVRKDEFQKRANQMAKLAKRAVSEGGSSYCNLDRLIKYIKSMVE
ncbi:7-deoxyloganetic acid glucosyl transferase-like [Cornus florida]|uniref:7-deoxyloganetic acid glucosyl transferase-like n=1 Tax=Cornus florida TaxID=4283 RepID=UPI00289F3E86|nr:7-deoxyloganetic acid glucosyl transferase-like [Cornus florida]